MDVSAKIQLHPPYSFWGDDFLIFFLPIYPFGCHGNQSNSAVRTKFKCLVEDYSRNICVKLLSKYLQWDSNKGLLSLFPHYKSVTIATWVLIQLRLKQMPLLVPLAYRCYMWNLVRIGLMASAEISFENVDRRQKTTDDRQQMPANTISSHMRLWLTGELQININPKMIFTEIIVFIIIVLTLISENEVMGIVF